MAGTKDMRCTHCLLPVKESQVVYDNEGRVFCCQGCMGVYHLIKEEGFEDFYRRRKDWRPGPVEAGTVTSLEAFKDSLTRLQEYMALDLMVGGIRCASCVWLIERFLKRQKGIVSVRVNYGTHSARVVFDPERTTLKDVLEAFFKIGYRPIPLAEGGAIEATRAEARDLLVRFGTGAFFSMQVMLLSVALYAGYFQGIGPVYKKVFQIVAWAFSTPVIFYAGAGFLKGLLRSLKQLSPSMDTLIGLGGLSAYLYSATMVITGGEVYFDSACMIITIILLGRYIETVARLNSLKALFRLVEIYPQRARVIGPEGDSQDRSIEDVSVGEVVEVLQGERFPLDGIITEGITEVDESLLTGEALPVKKTEGQEVFAGTVNLVSTVRVRVTKRASDTLLRGILKAVQEAQNRRPPIQALADRVSGVFVPLVITLALGTWFYWTFRAGTAEAVINGVSVLVVACPCALGLATPLAILRTSTSASRIGIIIKDSKAIEMVVKTDTLCLDKTGTLTKTEPHLKKVISFGLYPEDYLLDLASTIEQKANHPLKKAFTGRTGLISGLQVEGIPGRGLLAKTPSSVILLGSEALMKEHGITLPELDTPPLGVVVYMAIDGVPAGAFLIEMPLKEGVRDVIRYFKGMGLRTVILSGDRQEAVSAVAEILQADRALGGLNPFEKAEYIKDLLKDGRIVTMVGDGINDGPALREAHVGIASHNATDLAVESSQVAILREDIGLLPVFYDLCKKGVARIRENLFWAFGYNLITIPLAVSGRIHPIISAILMVISSLLVVLNSLRIRCSGRSFSS